MRYKSVLNNKILRRSILAIFDICLIFISYGVTNFFLGKNVQIIDNSFLITSCIAIFIYIPIFIVFRVYRSITEYTGANEFVFYFVLSLLSGLLVTLVCMASNTGVTGIKENVLASLFITGFMVSSRVAFRLLMIEIQKNKETSGETKNVLIVGAGSAGLQVVRYMVPKIDKSYNIVGMIDDDVSKTGSSISGIRIIGTRDKITSVCEKHNIDIILFAIANISKEEKIRLLDICSKTKAQVKIIPDIKDILANKIKIKMDTFKDVQIEDLLGREPIKLENDDIKKYIYNKVVLVTGGGGSIGSELCRQIASFGAKELVMLDIYENTLYEVELEIRKKFPDSKLTAVIASVRDNKRIGEVFEKYKPQIVFHAAAHKHVPLMETSPIEAIKNNVFGTYNVARAADRNEVEKFILVSTDKAVNPTSVMGATKRICEMVIQMQNSKSKTNYVAVRFGNVLGSHGSVIPIFKKQIAQGGPITVTHKDITRYFMTIPEAVGLILQAITFADGGEIFVLDMGEPVKIYDLAEKMIRLSGLEPNVDIPIEITGLRPGEKLYEELLVSEEGLSKTIHDKIMVTKIMDFNTKEIYKDLSLLRRTINSKDAINNAKIKKIIKKIVPTFIEEKEHTKNIEQAKEQSNKDTIEYIITLNKNTKKKSIKRKQNAKETEIKEDKIEVSMFSNGG